MPAEPVFEIDEARANGNSVFAIHVDSVISAASAAQLGDAWSSAWSKTGRTSAPPLLVLHRGCRLSELGEGAMRNAGWVRLDEATAHEPRSAVWIVAAAASFVGFVFGAGAVVGHFLI